MPLKEKGKKKDGPKKKKNEKPTEENDGCDDNLR
jgi:hypothetical protein